MPRSKNAAPFLLPSRRQKEAPLNEADFNLEPLCITAMYNPHNGYGELARRLTVELSRLIPLLIHADCKYHEQLIELGIYHLLAPANPRPKSLISIQPTFSTMNPPFGYRSAIFTMFETSRLKSVWINTINKFNLLITPSHANAADFLEQVTCPVEVANLGHDETYYTLQPFPKNGPFVFGAAAHVGHGRSRKGIDRIISWFETAFPDNRDVRLKLKLNNWNENLVFVKDPRIEVIESDLSEMKVREWLTSLNCYIDGSTFEGWGMWNHHAMALGRPVIGSNYSARCEYFKFGNHIPIGYRTVPSSDQYTGLGHWAMPDHEDAIEAMRWAFNNPDKCESIGIKAHHSIKHLTWKNFAKRIVEILNNHNIIQT